MGLPVVIMASGGLAVTEATNGLGLPVDVATNGFGLGVTIVASGGLPVVGVGATLNLSASTIADTASVGDVIGTLSVSGGTGTYTYTFTSNPGTLFSITTNSLKVAAALTAGSDPITIKADNGAGSVVTRAFNITVTSSAFAPSLDFSDPRNSQYAL